jgi:hypothetical protein
MFRFTHKSLTPFTPTQSPLLHVQTANHQQLVVNLNLLSTLCFALLPFFFQQLEDVAWVLQNALLFQPP